MGLGVRSSACALVAAAMGAMVSGCNDNGIAAMSGDLRASPDFIDYGLVKEQTEFAQTVIVSNDGGQAAEIRGLRLEPADAPFRFTEEIPTTESPWVVERGSYQAIELAFAPVVNGVKDGQLVIETSVGDLLVDLTGHGYHTTLDDYEQGGTVGGKADILFIVDNSGSMSEEQTKLGQSFNTFINWLVGGEVDYRIALTTTDMDATGAQGAFVASGSNPRILDMTTPDIATVFAQNVNVGIGGSADEKGLAAASTAVSPAMLAGANAGFLRDDARLYVVWVTDEDDASSGTPASHQNAIVAAKGGDPDQVFFAAIAGPDSIFDFSCIDASPATRYVNILNATGGLRGSICDADFGVTLQDLAFEVTSAGGTFQLTELPDPMTIQVMVDGIPQATTTWTYITTQNAIAFVPGFEPAGGAAVTISYDVL